MDFGNNRPVSFIFLSLISSCIVVLQMLDDQLIIIIKKLYKGQNFIPTTEGFHCTCFRSFFSNVYFNAFDMIGWMDVTMHIH